MFSGKKVLITGGSKGIGLAIAKKFVKKNARVVITGRNEESLKKACETIGGRGIDYTVWDISDISKISEQFTKVVNSLGGLDILVNNAGVLTKNDYGGMFAVTPETWDYTMNINLRSVFFLSQAIAEYMRDNGVRGRIVNVCSNNAYRAKDTAYAAAKWGVRGLTAGMGKALAPYGIIVNGVAPGPTSTTILGVEDNSEIKYDGCVLGRYSYPDEIADVVLFLAGEQAGSIIGQTIISDGGETLL